MRTIRFRGKSEDNSRWFYGFLQKYQEKYGSRLCICAVSVSTWKDALLYSVRPDTIGQFTGLLDKNGNEIYEGDILQFGNSPSGVCEVKWNESIAAFCIRFHFENEIGSRPLGEGLVEKKNIAIIGNIHDNPELMKADEKSKD